MDSNVREVWVGRGGTVAGMEWGWRAQYLVAALDELDGDLAACCLVQGQLDEAKGAGVEVTNLRNGK